MKTGVGARLAEERKRLKMSQAAFAEYVGVSFSSQRRYENESSSPDTSYLETLREHGIDVDYVLTGTPYSDNESDRIIIALQNSIKSIGSRLGSNPQAIHDLELFPLEEKSVFQDGCDVPDRLIDAFFNGCIIELDAALLSSTLERVEDAVSASKMNLTPAKKAQAVAMLYRAFRASGKVDPVMVEETLKLAS
ncbi:MAG: helix-turn-helix transcriptional regulator [Hydrogenophaga sp.]|nr:helix-turn-helix transcriptional regulator [Hydrogenophaga sp.]